MTTLQITLPEDLRAFIESQVAQGDFDTASDYIHALILRAQKNQEHLETLLLEGIQSGEATPMTSEGWNDLRSRVQEQARQNQG